MKNNKKIFYTKSQSCHWLIITILFISSFSLFAQTIEPIKSVETDRKIIAYTFDDGPVAGITEQLLELFKKEEVKVTFFNIGKKISANTELSKRVLEEGHEIGNHSYGNGKLTDIEDSNKIFALINDFQELAKTELDYTPKLFRAPSLKYDERVTNVLSKLNLKLVSAEIFSGDASSDSDTSLIIQKILDNVVPGAIILGHERQHTVEVVKTIIPILKSEGYQFVTVSELLKITGDWKKINPNDNKIHITGAKFSKVSDEMIDFQRHSDSLLALSKTESRFNPVRAKTTSGIVISFRTKSPNTKIYFKMLEGENRNGEFGIFQDGVLSSTQSLSETDDSLVVIDIQSINSNEETLYEITLPTWNNLAFLGLDVDASYDLIDYQPDERKIYVAYGNSITHGTGQKGTHQTYAYQVAKNFDWELFNVAVGGAKTSVTIADMLRDDFEQIDYLTVLIGFNDYNGEGVDTLEYKNRYESVLRSIREHHKTTSIFCLTPTLTTQLNSKKSGIPISDFRKVVTNLVNKFKNDGDEKIYLIKAETFSSESDLQGSVHFNVEGAANLADSLTSAIRSIIDSLATGIEDTNDGHSSNTKNGISPKYSLYPNPSNGRLNIESDEKIKSINIYNILGQSVKSFSSNIKKLQVADLSKGIYFLKITNGVGAFQIKKFLVRR